MKTTPTAILVLGATTVAFCGEPGGIGGCDPSDTHLRWCLTLSRGFRKSELLYAGVRGDRTHDFNAASSSGGRTTFIVNGEKLNGN
jgi:hypothetical protein